jgi:hypothetical protein
MYFDFICKISATFLILKIIQLYMIKMYVVLRLKYPLLLSNFNENSIFLTDFRKIIKCQIS